MTRLFERIIPPAGTRITLSDLLHAWFGVFLPGDARKDLTRELCALIGSKYAFPVDSGRTALLLILRALSKQRERGEVIIPGYTCYSVAAAIKQAGLKARAVDVLPNSLDYSPEKLREATGDNTLAILAVYPFCTSINIDLIREIARKSNIPVIEDAAQSMGLKIDQKYAGSIGDIGFFSLSKGKTITSVRGGLIVTNNSQCADLIEKQVQSLSTSSVIEELRILLIATGMKVLIHPALFGFAKRLLRLKLGETNYDPAFNSAQMPSAAARLARRMLRRMDATNNDRQKNGLKYGSQLIQSTELRILAGTDSDTALFLRYPILLRNKLIRDSLFKKLTHLGASRMYLAPIQEIDDESLFSDMQTECPNASRIADCLLTLPTHKYIKDRDIQELSRSILQMVEVRSPVDE